MLALSAWTPKTSRRPKPSATPTVHYVAAALGWAVVFIVLHADELSSYLAVGFASGPDPAGPHFRPRHGLSLSEAHVHWQGLFHAVAMTLLVMGPSVSQTVQYVGSNSLRWRRYRAVIEFVTAYCLVWLVFDVLVGSVAATVRFAYPWQGWIAAVFIAGLWQLSPWKRHCLRQCHRGIPLPPSGWAAEKAALQFGVRNAAACVGSCWAIMVVMMLAPQFNAAVTLAVTSMVGMERLAPTGLKLARRTGIVLLAFAFGVVCKLAARA
jgi:predicted metal-binding membrane protein